MTTDQYDKALSEAKNSYEILGILYIRKEVESKVQLYINSIMWYYHKYKQMPLVGHLVYRIKYPEDTQFFWRVSQEQKHPKIVGNSCATDPACFFAPDYVEAKRFAKTVLGIQFPEKKDSSGKDTARP